MGVQRYQQLVVLSFPRFGVNQYLVAYSDGVYKAGFANSTDAYEAAVRPLFEALDKVETMLEGKEFFVGNQLTEADIRLWVTIVRFRVAFPSAHALVFFCGVLGCH